MSNTDLILAADTAAIDKKTPKIDVLGYSGGLMTVPGWGPVVIDLAGLVIAAQTPLLADHADNIDGAIGYGSATVVNGQLRVIGVLTPGGKLADRIIELSKAGQRLQASVGVKPTQHTRVRAGTAVKANGQTITAPEGGLTLVEAGILKEVSVCVLGADDNTNVLIEAKRMSKTLTSGTNPETIQTVPDESGDLRGQAGEADRILAIRKVCAGSHPDIEAQAIENGWNATKAGLSCIRAARPRVAPYIHTGGSYQAVALEDKLEAAFHLQSGREDLAVKYMKPEAIEAAKSIRARHVMDILAVGLTDAGRPVPRDNNDFIRAAHSNYSITTALSNVANKHLYESYGGTAPTWRELGAIKSVRDFKDNTGIRVTDTGELQEVPEGGDLKSASLTEATYTFSVDTYGEFLRVDRRALINDDLSLFYDMAATLGEAARRKIADLFYTLLLANTGSFFHADNSNLLTGTATALSASSLGVALYTMREQTDSVGRTIDMVPKTLLVPPILEATARSILQSEYIEVAEGTTTGNGVRNAVSLVVEPRLSNASFTGYSNTGWYLFAAPSKAAMVAAFLDGKQEPTIEFFGIDSDPTTLAATWRVYHDFGVAFGDYRAAVKCTGTT